MFRFLTLVAILMTGLLSLAAAPVQSRKSEPAKLAQVDQLTPLPFRLGASSSFEDEDAADRFQTCSQQCDVAYIRTHQLCVAAVSGLKTPDAPQASACERAAKAGIQQCQSKCEAAPETIDAKATLD